jgi:hypothetical protein
MNQSQPAFAKQDFDIILPDPGTAQQVDSANRILVKIVESSGNAFATYSSVIVDYGASASGSSTLLARTGTTTLEALVPVGGTMVPTTIPSAKNKTVHVTGENLGSPAVPHALDFKAYRGSSGSAATMMASETAKQEFQSLFTASNPVANDLHLQFHEEAEVGAEGERPRFVPVILSYSNDHELIGSWFSSPQTTNLSDCPVAIWHLRKVDPRSWSLRFCWREREFAAYRSVESDGNTFPVRLLAVADGDWPKAALVTAR